MSGNIQEFFENLASSVGIPKENVKELISLPSEDEEATPLSLALEVEKENPPISISADGPIVEVRGDNGTNKTRSLLYLSNLLGYDFSNSDNRRFLNHPEIIEQGLSAYRKLVDGKNFELVLETDEYRLFLSPAEVGKSWVKLEITSKESEEVIRAEKYDLQSMGQKFRREIKEYLYPIFISKGRDFSRQILENIRKELRSETEEFKKGVRNLIREQSDSLEIPESMRSARQKPQNRLDAIKKELGNLRPKCKERQNSLSDLEDELGLITELEDLVRENEGEETFEKLSEAYDLKNKIRRLEETRKPKEKAKELQSKIEKKEEKLEDKKQEFSEKKELVEAIDKSFEGSLEKILEKVEEYELDYIVESLRSRRANTLYEELDKSIDPEAEDVIKNIYKTANQYDSSLNIPNWDDLGSLQEDLKNLLNTIRQNTFLESCLNPLINLLEKQGIESRTDYREMVEDKESLNEKVNSIQEEVEVLGTKKKNLEGKFSEKKSEEIENKLEKFRSRQKELKFEIESSSEAKDLHRRLNGLAKQVVEGREPLSLVYSSDWDSELEDKRKSRQEEIQKLRSNVEGLEKKIQSLGEEKEKIEEAVEKGEIERFENLTNLAETLDSLTFVLEGKTLFKRIRGQNNLKEEEKAVLDDLREYEALKSLDELINSLFKERCSHFFLMEDETCKPREIKEFDYLDRKFEYSNGGRKEISDPYYSGGTSSAMTIASLASMETSAKMGIILLVDESGDVGPSMREKIYKLLRSEDKLSCAVFVKLEEGTLRAKSV